MDAKDTARGCLHILGPIAWLVCVAGMGLMSAVFIEMGTEPPHENKLAGVILLPLAPTILFGTLIAAGILWLRWQTLLTMNRHLTELTAAATASLPISFAAAFLFPFHLFPALLAAATLATHILTITPLHIQLWRNTK